MKAKFLNQQYTKEVYDSKGYLIANTKFWSTAYVTDLPIEVTTDEADRKIKEFINKHFPQEQEYRIERNGMTRLWQFTVVTNYEVMKWEITEETDNERRARLMPIAEKWWNKVGYAEYGKDFYIDDIKEQDNGNTLIIMLLNDSTGTSAILKRNNKGSWTWQHDEN